MRKSSPFCERSTTLPSRSTAIAPCPESWAAQAIERVAIVFAFCVSTEERSDFACSNAKGAGPPELADTVSPPGPGGTATLLEGDVGVGEGGPSSPPLAGPDNSDVTAPPQATRTRAR